MKNSEQNTTPLISTVEEFILANRIPYYMPGHLQGRVLPDTIKNTIMENPFLWDLTEVDGLDCLQNPTKAIKVAQDLTADLYGVDQSFFLINGSTVGVMTMILSVLKPGDKLLLQRNSHQSALSGITLGRIKPIWIQPSIISDYQIPGGVKPKEFKKIVQDNPDAKAVLITSPSYYGLSQDIEQLIEIAHQNNLIVMVDEAHGSHFPFHSSFPTSSLKFNADLVTHSLHKTLPALTQTALLHVNKDRVNIQNVSQVLSMLQTSSPSYLFMISIDGCRKMMAVDGTSLLDETISKALYIRKKLTENRISILNSNTLTDSGIVQLDPTKVVINTQPFSFSGFEVAQILREQFNIEVEMATSNAILCMITNGLTKDDLDTLSAALMWISKTRHRKATRRIPLFLQIPKQIYSPSEAFYLSSEFVPLTESVHRIAKRAITPFPPGVPAVCPGEMLTKEVVDSLLLLNKENVVIHGINDKTGVEVIVSSR